jgi:hypothetical protein
MARTEFRELTTWPTGRAPTPASARVDGQFRAALDVTYRELDRELDRIGARDPRVSVAVPERALRKYDGRPGVHASPTSPEVVLTFTSKEGHPITIPCDHFRDWRDNLRAIVLTLHDLRRIDRYGTAATGEQYRGWAQLPSVTTTVMNTAQAAEFLAKRTADHYSAPMILGDPASARSALRVVLNHLHPDNGGRSGDFAIATDAGRVLAAHHGVEKL